MTRLRHATDTPQASDDGLELLGTGIRRERLRRGLTLAQLAQRTGVTSSALSQVERGVIDPSIGLLRRIAAALQVPMFQFLATPASSGRVVRKSARPSITLPHSAMQYQLLTPDLRGSFEVLIQILEPGAASGEQAVGHDSDECVLLLSGRIEIEIAGELYELDAGDSVSIPRNAPHRAVNRTTEPAEVLMVISPPQTF